MSTKTKTQIYRVKGMHCASCASIIERTVKKSEGVNYISVNVGTEKAKLDFDETKISLNDLNQKLVALGYELEPDTPSEHIHHEVNQTKLEKTKEIKNLLSSLILALPLSVITLLMMIYETLAVYQIVPMMPSSLESFFHHLLPIFATLIFAMLGRPYLLGVYRFLRYGKANMDTLIGLGTSVAFIYSFIVNAFEEVLAPYLDIQYNFYDAVIIVITFITLGKYLEAKSKLKTGDAIEKLLGMQAKSALVIRSGKELEISIEQVVTGDIIIVKPGQQIPVDGIITQGTSYVDEAMITGEPIPVEKIIGSTVIAGTINTSGTFNFEATKVGAETLLSHIIKMVENAQGSKAPIQALADRISAVFVPVVLIIALLTFSIWLYFGVSIFGFGKALSYALTAFVGILVIACPCALGLATPTAIIVGVGKGAREGILVKDAATLETLHKANVVVVDKTGTITIGKPELTKIENLSQLTDEEIISLLATLESKSEHPIAHAIVNYAEQNNIETKSISEFSSIKGKGLTGIINQTKYYAGNTKILNDISIPYDNQHLDQETIQGKTPILLTDENTLLAIVYVADQIKPEAVETVNKLHKLNKKVVMLTGDNKNTADYIAKLVGIDKVIAEVLPSDKLNVIKEFQAAGNIVVMAGDGVNDAPALAQADVGVAMSTGTDVAIESAGITLLGGDVTKLVKAIELSKMTMLGIKQNLFWAFFYNVIGIPLAGGILFPSFGILLSPVFAGFAMAMSSVSVVTNSLRIKTKKL